MDRGAMSPAQLEASLRAAYESDVRDVLRGVDIPTLVLHRVDDPMISVAHGRYLAANLPRAKYKEFPGSDHTMFVGDAESIALEIEEFVTGARSARHANRVLATVLFTDIVGSTDQAVRLGDEAWTELLRQHHVIISRELDRHRGRRVNPTGDGVFATFDGPARAIRCAQAIVDAVRLLGMQVRAGLHTGEVELHGDDVGGLAVHIGQRVSALAAPGEVIVSRTVTDLVAGSGLEFVDRGEHELKGVPGRWQLYAVKS
jgi:class 3 adenylate cyclase